MSELNLDINVVCDKCGKNLSYEITVEADTIKVTPCEDCLQTSYDKGYYARG